MGASFFEIAYYLQDVWPGWKAAVRAFLFETLPALCDDMLTEAHDQQAGEAFLDTLADLLEHDRVALAPQGVRDGRDVVGKRMGQGHGPLLAVSTSLALEAVQRSLRAQGRPDLKVTRRTLLDQQREAGKLSDETGSPLAAGAAATRQVRVAGGNPCQCMYMYESVLTGQCATAAEAHASQTNTTPARRPSAQPPGQAPTPAAPAP